MPASQALGGKRAYPVGSWVRISNRIPGVIVLDNYRSGLYRPLAGENGHSNGCTQRKRRQPNKIFAELYGLTDETLDISNH